MKAKGLLLLNVLLIVVFPPFGLADECVECHRNQTPAAAKQWFSNAHFV